MRKELDNEKKISILQALKKIFIDNPENTDEIPGIDKIIPTSPEEAKILEELKKHSAENIEKRINFKKSLEVKYSSKLGPKVQSHEVVNNKDKDIKERE